MQTKAELRRLMRRRRRALSPAERAHASRTLCMRLKRLPSFTASRYIGIYLPIDGEIDVTLVIRSTKAKQFYLPILPPRGQRRLWFGLYEPDTRLIPDRFGIPEPVTARKIRAESLDLVLVPLVAFDDSGGRIGMGGGFYDGTLSFASGRSRARPVAIIGAAYQFQRVDYIPRDYWDIPLSGVITDQCFMQVKTR